MDTTIVFAADAPATTISDRVRRAELVRLATGVYTSDVTSDPAAVVAREWHIIAGGMFPGAVITDRSAITGGPIDDVLYLARDGRAREVELPGLRAREAVRLVVPRPLVRETNSGSVNVGSNATRRRLAGLPERFE